jgi:hypothetical protein
MGLFITTSSGRQGQVDPVHPGFTLYGVAAVHASTNRAGSESVKPEAEGLATPSGCHRGPRARSSVDRASASGA